MYAARLFNAQKGNDISIIHGALLGSCKFAAVVGGNSKGV